MNEFWSRPTCVILTGASKGIGQSLAVEISRLLVPDSTIVLIARDTNGLEKTKDLVMKENGDILVEVCKKSNNFVYLLIYTFFYSIIALIWSIQMQPYLKRLLSLLMPQSMNYFC